MFKTIRYKIIILVFVYACASGCKIPAITTTGNVKPLPAAFENSVDTVNSGNISWRNYFNDPYLVSLIDTALKNNQELLITLQEIEIARNDIRFRKAALLPTVSLGGTAGVEKVGRYTSQGAGDATTDIKPGRETPDPLMDYRVAVMANWEIDIWKKLRNARKAAVARYLSTIEGRNFVITNLIAEIANSYYELLALDNQLLIVKQTIGLQENALEIVRVQKEAARATELGVQKFQAEVLKSQSLEYDILQQIRQTENRINLLLGRYAHSVARGNELLVTIQPPAAPSGIPAQLLINRPDIRQAELELTAARLDVKVARAEFYPSLGISAGIGLQAFNPSYLLRMPESLLYSLAGDLVGPLINKNAIKAEFKNANARQLQALYNYDRSILTAFLEVNTQLSNIQNLGKSYELKSKQVDALLRSIDVANDLFKSARADYFEVLMTQRDALESRMELVETKKRQLIATVNIYRNLGGGWR